jgi:hypothetical protein
MTMFDLTSLDRAEAALCACTGKTAEAMPSRQGEIKAEAKCPVSHETAQKCPVAHGAPS